MARGAVVSDGSRCSCAGRSGLGDELFGEKPLRRLRFWQGNRVFLQDNAKGAKVRHCRMNFALKGASIFDNWRRRMTKSAVCVGRFRWNLPRLLANLVDGSVQDLINYAPRKGKKNVH